MIKSDIFYDDAIELHLAQINRVKNLLILVAKEDGIDNSEAIDLLKSLVDLEHDLNGMKSNLPFISIDEEKLSKAKE